jgi:hypothetical protein
VRTDSWTVELKSEILDSFAGMSFENNMNNGRWKRFLAGRMSGVESLKLRSQEFQWSRLQQQHVCQELGGE